MSWWSSADTIDRLATGANWGVAVCGFLAAIAGIAAIVLSSRSAMLKATADAQRTAEEQQLRQRVSAAEALLKEAQEKQATAEKRVDEVEAESAAASKAAGEAQRSADEQKPRTLSAQQQDRLISALRSGPIGDINVQIPLGGGGEIQGLAGILERCLLAAGWRIQNRALIPLANETTGVHLVVQSNAQPPERAVWLQKALREVSIEALGNENGRLAPDQVNLIIARKP